MSYPPRIDAFMPTTPDTAFEAVRSTLLWAGLSTVLVMIPGTLLAYLLARFEFRGSQILSTLLSLPLVIMYAFVFIDSFTNSPPGSTRFSAWPTRTAPFTSAKAVS